MDCVCRKRIELDATGGKGAYQICGTVRAFIVQRGEPHVSVGPDDKAPCGGISAARRIRRKQSGIVLYQRPVGFCCTMNAFPLICVAMNQRFPDLSAASEP